MRRPGFIKRTRNQAKLGSTGEWKWAHKKRSMKSHSWLISLLILPKEEQEHVRLVKKRLPALEAQLLLLLAVQTVLLGRALMVAAA